MHISWYVPWENTQLSSISFVADYIFSVTLIAQNSVWFHKFYSWLLILIVGWISFQNDAENICSKIANLKYVPRSSGETPRTFLGLFGRNEICGKYQKRLEDLEENVRMEQSNATRRQVHSFVFIGTKKI
jgi:hypothetical protein